MDGDSTVNIKAAVSSPILGCFLPLLSSAGRTKLVPAVLVTTRNLDFSFRVRGDR